jgi:quercetin dioxygenase-like cupin family protein
MKPGVTMRVVVGPEQNAPFFNMRVFEVQPGCSTPHHSHWWEHEVFILSGTGIVRTAEGERNLTEGTVVFIPGGEKHQFMNTGSGILRFICVVPQKWLEQIDRKNPL